RWRPGQGGCRPLEPDLNQVRAGLERLDGQRAFDRQSAGAAEAGRRAERYYVAPALEEKRESQRVADRYSGTIDRNSFDSDAGLGGTCLTGGKERVLARIEPKNEAAEDPLASPDVEIQLRRVQEDVV